MQTPSNPFPEKVIITTATKIKLLQSLSEFWSLKSLFIQAKANPSLLGSETFQQRTLEYFEKSSVLAKQKFWASLSLEARKKAAKYFVLQEVLDTSHSRITETQDSAALYVVLNGSATVKTSDCADEVVYNTGDIFGAVDIFNEAYENTDGVKEKLSNKDETGNHRVMTAMMKKGTYLRISLVDFYKHVLSVDKVVAGIDQEEYSRISELSWEELNDDDKSFIDVYLRTKKVLKKDFFDFLSTFKLIPFNARVSSRNYYKEGHIGNHIDFHPRDPPNLFIILGGGVRVEVESRRGGAGTHTVSCKRRGKKPMVVKTYSMPLVLLEEGALLGLQRESFFVGSVDPELESAGSPQRGVVSTPDASGGGSDGLGPLPTQLSGTGLATPLRVRRDSESSASSFASESSRSLTHTTRATHLGKKAKHTAHGLYKLRMVFDKTTQYLLIPWATIERHLEDRIVPRAMAASIRSQISNTNEVLQQRLNSLLPWITGGMSFNGPPILSSVGDYSICPLDNTLLSTVAANNRARKSKNHVGSFTYSRLHLNAQSSVETSSNISTMRDESTFNTNVAPVRVVSQPSSRLRSMISNLKKQRAATKRAITKLSFITEAAPMSISDDPFAAARVTAQKVTSVVHEEDLLQEEDEVQGEEEPREQQDDGKEVEKHVNDPPPSISFITSPARRASMTAGISNSKPFSTLSIIAED